MGLSLSLNLINSGRPIIQFIADLHIHSHFSRATSKALIPEQLYKWAQLKGITVIGTGDFTHPGWLKELEEKLEPAEMGLYRLKKSWQEPISREIFDSCKKEVRFILSAEISCIYKKNDRVRKVHHMILAPDFTTVKKIQLALSKIGNITSDGRPILGLDSKNLLDLVLTASPECCLIPAHIWTPWFSILGSKSGFNSIEECFEELSPHIFALETGLSSDPAMNWLCSILDRYSLISNSDAHSPENIGREANLFNSELSYSGIIGALKNKNDQFNGTIEFFPQEGKYHYDGHRKCEVVWNPQESLEHRFICPVCGQKVTLGVMYRVAELSDRHPPAKAPCQKPFNSLIPLKEMIAEIYQQGKNSKKVNQTYLNLLIKYGSEFNILLNESPEDLVLPEIPLLAEGIRRMRSGQVHIQSGYDGEYGIIKVFAENEIEDLLQKNLFNFDSKDHMIFPAPEPADTLKLDLNDFKNRLSQNHNDIHQNQTLSPPSSGETLNPSQTAAVQNLNGPSLIIAGPGTGKTKTLTYKLAALLNAGISPQQIAALTFSTQAANEMKERIQHLLSNQTIEKELTIATFHAFGLAIIDQNPALFSRNAHYTIINNRYQDFLIKQFMKSKNAAQLLNTISQTKQRGILPEQIEDPQFKEFFIQYNAVLQNHNLFDFDDLLYLPVLLFMENQELLKRYRDRYQWIVIDEYQDINDIQYRLIRLLAANSQANLTAIGDPHQAIYGFRGADIRYIEAFKTDYPEAVVYQLEKSYRCTNTILNASRQIISEPKKPAFYLQGIEDELKISIKEYSSEKTEAEFVAREIENLIGGLRFFSIDSGISHTAQPHHQFGLSDFAVLCRTGQQMQAIEKAFTDHTVPYQKIGETPFYRNPPFNKILDVLKLILYPENRFLKPLIIELNLSDNDLEKLSAERLKTRLNDFLHNLIIRFIHEDLGKYEKELDLINDLALHYADQPEQFLRFTETSQSIDLLQPQSERVKLMTMHAAKGLEFQCVFIIGCSEKYLPFSLYDQYTVNIEEEKRLLYVAMTRARKYLYLSYPQKIERFGKKIAVNRSPFIDKIKDELIDFNREKTRKLKREPGNGQLSLFDDD